MKYPIVLVVLVAAAGCGAPKKFNGTEIKLRAKADHDVTARFGVIPEPTAPAGFEPQIAAYEDGRFSMRAGGSGGSGLVTLVLLDGCGQDQCIVPGVSRIEHVEASEPVYHTHYHTLFAPIVSATGERLTQVYRFERSPPVLAPLGPPMPRVVRMSSTKNPEHKVLAIPTGEPDMYRPVRDDGTVALPAGAVDALAVRSTASPADWTAWLVRWDGPQGRGWSAPVFNSDPTFREGEAALRWTALKVVDLEIYNRVIVAARPDQTCEVADLDGISAHDASCDAALSNLVAARLAASRAEAAAIARAKAAADEAKRQQEAEWAKPSEPKIEEFKRAATAHNYFAACMLAKKLKPEDQTTMLTLVVTDKLGKNVAREYSGCFPNANAKEVYAARDAHEAKLAQERVAARQVSSTASGASDNPDPNRGAREAKQRNDWLYGSGRASSCPFSSYICR